MLSNMIAIAQSSKNYLHKYNRDYLLECSMNFVYKNKGFFEYCLNVAQILLIFFIFSFFVTKYNVILF